VAGPVSVIPRGIVWLLSTLTAITFLSEGAVLEWSASLMNSTRLVTDARGGLGYMLFSVAMTTGRLFGIRWLDESVIATPCSGEACLQQRDSPPWQRGRLQELPRRNLLLGASLEYRSCVVQARRRSDRHAARTGGGGHLTFGMRAFSSGRRRSASLPD
jgi:hypothetical protein